MGGPWHGVPRAPRDPSNQATQSLVDDAGCWLRPPPADARLGPRARRGECVLCAWTTALATLLDTWRSHHGAESLPRRLCAPDGGRWGECPWWNLAEPRRV